MLKKNTLECSCLLRRTKVRKDEFGNKVLICTKCNKVIFVEDNSCITHRIGITRTGIGRY